MRVELAVRDVVEIDGANGYVLTLVGHIPHTTPDTHTEIEQQLSSVPSWAPVPKPELEFFPAAAISVTMQLEWRSFAVAKPPLAEFGSTVVVDIEPGTVPSTPVNRGPQAPARRL